MLPIITLQLFSEDLERITQGLEAKINQAQGFFKDTPVVLDFTPLATAKPELSPLLQAVKNAGLAPVAARTEDAQLQVLLSEANLVLIKDREREAPTARVEKSASKAPASSSTRIHDRPVRSGQQLYGKNSDLVLTTQTSAGSEVIADGSIHVYGTLRGRALAGVSGDTQARIFCEKFEAELVAISGHYKLIDDIPSELRGEAVQIWLENESLKIEKLTT